MEQEWLLVFVEDKISLDARLLEYFSLCCLSRMFISRINMSTGSKPLLVSGVVDHENFFVFWVYDTAIRDDMPSKIFTRSDILLPFLQLLYKNREKLLWIQ